MTNNIPNKNDFFLSRINCWIFAYGSLMWDFPFPYIQKSMATLSGYDRSFCMYSVIYRGSKDKPGLVLSLDNGNECNGIAYHLPEEEAYNIFSAIWDREMITNAYIPQILPITLPNNNIVKAICFTANHNHEQYIKLTIEQQAKIITTAKGTSGNNIDYFSNTYHHLTQMGIADEHLEQLYNAIFPHLI